MNSPTHLAPQDDLAKLDPGVAGWYSRGAQGTLRVVLNLSRVPDDALSAALGGLGIGVFQSTVLTGTVTREQLESLIALPEVVEVADGTIAAAPGGVADP